MITPTTRTMLKFLAMGWTGLLVVGFLIRLWGTPTLVLLIDRSYCPPQDWQEVVQHYTTIYRQNQSRQVHLQAVIFFSTLGEDSVVPPPPETLASVATYGRPDPQRLQQLQQRYPHAQVLGCARS